MTHAQWLKLWEHVNEYAEACGGDTSAATAGLPRSRAVAAIEHDLAALEHTWRALVNWFSDGEPGLSSETIVGRIVHVGTFRTDHPLDPSDLYRCIALLDAVPGLRDDFHRMADVSPVWARFVESWDVLERTLRQECQAAEENGTFTAPRTYQLMREIRGNDG